MAATATLRIARLRGSTASLLIVLAAILLSTVRASTCSVDIKRASELQRQLKSVPAENITFAHVRDAYLPDCTPGYGYNYKQCYVDVFNGGNLKFCWCSTREGNLVEGTFQQGDFPLEECLKCRIDGNVYDNHQHFHLPYQKCHCQKSAIKCHPAYCHDHEKGLSEYESNELKLTVMAMFLCTTYNPKHLKNCSGDADVRNAALNDRSHLLQTHFHKYDQDTDKLLSEIELAVFLSDISCFLFNAHCISDWHKEFDANGDGTVSLREWKDFLVYEQPSPSPVQDDPIGSGNDDREKIVTRRDASSIAQIKRHFRGHAARHLILSLVKKLRNF